MTSRTGLPPEAEIWLKHAGRPRRAAILMSGTGANAEALLADVKMRGEAAPWRCAVMATDAPETSRTRAIAAAAGCPVVELDIRAFYRARGLETISLATEAGRAARQAWTEALWRLLEPYRIDFGLLAGFVPLSDLPAHVPCLNVHPGDLTVVDAAGGRPLAGYACKPIERVLCDDATDVMRSSVILPSPFFSAAATVDDGPVLGVSPEVPADRGGLTAAELRAIRAARRPGTTPDDELRRLARRNLENLKLHGDLAVFPAAARAFAEGRFAHAGARLFFHAEEGWMEVSTVEFGPAGERPRPV